MHAKCNLTLTQNQWLSHQALEDPYLSTVVRNLAYVRPNLYDAV